MNNPNLKKFYQNSPKPVNYLPNVLVDGPPQYSPTMSGLMLINPATKDIWVSAGNKLVSDWVSIVGGGSGTSITLQTNNVTNPVQNILNLYSTDGTIQLLSDGVGGVDFSIPGPSKPAKQIEVLFSDETIALSSAFAGFSGLLLNTLAGYSYSFRIFCAFDIDNTSYATRWAVRSTDPAPTYLGYSTSAPGSAIGSFIYNSSVTTYNGTTNAAGTNVSATGNVAIIEGIYTPSEDSDFGITAANEGQVGTTLLTLKAGSYIEYIRVAL